MKTITYYNHIDGAEQEQILKEILQAIMDGEYFELLVDDGDGDVWRHSVLADIGELMEAE